MPIFVPIDVVLLTDRPEDDDGMAGFLCGCQGGDVRDVFPTIPEGGREGRPVSRNEVNTPNLFLLAGHGATKCLL